jgi:hypothetical protein
LPRGFDSGRARSAHFTACLSRALKLQANGARLALWKVYQKLEKKPDQLFSHISLLLFVTTTILKELVCGKLIADTNLELEAVYL